MCDMTPCISVKSQVHCIIVGNYRNLFTGRTDTDSCNNRMIRNSDMNRQKAPMAKKKGGREKEKCHIVWQNLYNMQSSN
uniref:Uncharacterized protein n=1 Tax=Setaria italica TaxID=4555 RepID=K3YKK6_SETIT